MKPITAAAQVLAAAFLAAQPVLSAPLAVPQPQQQPQQSQALTRRFQANTVINAVLSIFPARVTVSALSGTLTFSQAAIAAPLGVRTSENDGGCAKIKILFARGTTEPGNVGLLAGPAFIEAVEDKVGKGNVAAQGTNNYRADVPGFLLGGDKTGSQQLANDVLKTIQNCPNSKIVMGGYSQGGQLVHNAAKILGEQSMAKVSSVVIFGDPLDGTAVTGAGSKTKVFCNTLDNICDGGDIILAAHLTYSQDAEEAASFVVSQAGL